MSIPLFLSHLIGGAVGSVVFLPLAIMLCALFLEDATTIVVGVLAADHVISVLTALVSIYMGIIIGDAALYSIGLLAQTHPRLARYVDHDFTAPFRDWLEKRYAFNIFSGHFVPGLRLTTYVASGFFRCKLSTFIGMAIIGSLLWETILFSAAFWFGNLTSTWIEPARWGIALVFLAFMFFVARHNLRSYRAKKDNTVK